MRAGCASHPTRNAREETTMLARTHEWLWRRCYGDGRYGTTRGHLWEVAFTVYLATMRVAGVWQGPVWMIRPAARTKGDE